MGLAESKNTVLTRFMPVRCNMIIRILSRIQIYSGYSTANVKHFFTLLGNEFFTPSGKQFLTLSGNEFFTLYGKQFFTSPGKEFFTSCQAAGKAGRYLVN